MSECNRGVEGGGVPPFHPASRTKPEAGDPPISGGFPPPPHPKEEFPSPPSSAQGQNPEMQALDTFGQEELGDLGGDLAGDSFTLSRLLGTETVESPTNTWDSLSLANSNTPPATSQGYETPPSSSQSYDTPHTSSASFQSENNTFTTTSTTTAGTPTAPASYEPKSSPAAAAQSPYPNGDASASAAASFDGQTAPAGGYRPWEAEQKQQQIEQQRHQEQLRLQHEHQLAQHHQQQLHHRQQQQQQQQLHHFNPAQPHRVTTSQGVARPPAYYPAPPHHQLQYPPAHELPSFHSQFQFSDLVPPPNTQAPPGVPIPTTRYGQVGRYPVVTGHTVLPQHRPLHHYPTTELTPGAAAYSGQPSPNKFPGRVIAKARRPSQQQHGGQPNGGAAMSPGKFSPGAPYSPHQDPHRPASASSLERATPTQTNPASPANYQPANQTRLELLEPRPKQARTDSLEGSESDNSVRSSDPGIADGQVAAISSTDPTPETISGLAEAFKPPSEPTIGELGSPHMTTPNIGGHTPTHAVADTQEKAVKKKRKRCGECTGCQRKDNCGDCAPCRNDKSHQICKMRRCELLTEKKVSKKPRKNPNNTSFNGEFNGSQTFSPHQPSPGATAGGGTTTGWTPQVTPTEPWYPTSMGPPTPQQPARPTPTQASSTPLTFDTAYNFSGQNSSIVQEFFPQLSGNQNRPAGVGSEFLGQGAGPGYPAPQPMSYHLNVAAEKNLLMTSSALGMGSVQGNCRPGYPPRPMETSQTLHRVSSSTGYPGEIRTGQSPQHTLLSPAPPSAKQVTPLPSPAHSNDEHQVTSTKSPTSAEEKETEPVLTLLPPSSIIPDHYGIAGHKLGLVSGQEGFTYPFQ